MVVVEAMRKLTVQQMQQHLQVQQWCPPRLLVITTAGRKAVKGAKTHPRQNMPFLL
jgi:hypothetical protein